MAFRSPKTNAVLAVVLAVGLAVCIALWLYYPFVLRTAIGWLLLVLIGVPTYLLIEWLGSRVLRSGAVGRLGSGGRIALAVPAFILLAVVGAALLKLGGDVLAGR